MTNAKRVRSWMKSMTAVTAMTAIATLASVGCQAQIRAKVATETPPPPPPAPPPAPEPVKVGKIELPGQLEFENGSARIKDSESSKQILGALLEVLQKHPEITKLRIEGHTDNRGRAAANDKLSKLRAEAVAAWLEEHSVQRSRLSTIGHGQKKPAFDNDTPDHRQLNRRTEFHVEELNGKPPAEGEVAAASAPARG